MYLVQGKSVLDVANHFDISYELVRRRLKASGIPMRRQGSKPIDYNLAVKCPNGHVLTKDNRYISPKGRFLCKTCRNERQKADYIGNRDRYLKRSNAWLSVNDNGRRKKLRKFSMSIEEYDSKALSQGGVCAICKRPETRTDPRTGQVWALSVDHDHRTGKNRGLLCSRCNCGLGNFNENKDFLSRAIAYLTEYGG